MDRLPDSLLLQILSQLDNSADVARCRVASKALDSVFPDIRWINIRMKRCMSSRLETVIVDLISKMKIVESVRIRNAFSLETDREFGKEWVPLLSQSLTSLSILGIPSDNYERQSSVLSLISAFCHNLVNLNLAFAWLSLDNLNPMPMLTTLTLYSTRLEDEHLNVFNKWFLNLQLLKLLLVTGLQDPKIHLLNLQTYRLWVVYDNFATLTLITPNLINLTIECAYPAVIHVDAPMLSDFHLAISNFKHPEFPITKTVETLTLDSGNESPTDAEYSQLTLRKVFMVFPKVSSLHINSGAWSELEACLNPEGWEILDGRKGLKTLCAYLMLVDPSLTFSSVASFLDQCVGLSDISLLIHSDVVSTVSKSFMS